MTSCTRSKHNTTILNGLLSGSPFSDLLLAVVEGVRRVPVYRQEHWQGSSMATCFDNAGERGGLTALRWTACWTPSASCLFAPLHAHKLASLPVVLDGCAEWVLCRGCSGCTVTTSCPVPVPSAQCPLQVEVPFL